MKNETMIDFMVRIFVGKQQYVFQNTEIYSTVAEEKDVPNTIGEGLDS